LIFFTVYDFSNTAMALRDASIVTSTASEQTSLCYVGFEVFTAVTMKNGVFWDVTPGGSCKYRRFGGT
jgi:hypothetical protein